MFDVVMFRVEMKLGVPLIGLYVPVAPPGRPVTVSPTDGIPVVEDPDTNVMFTE